ncbi:MAG: hypothetical protein ABIW82_16655 [Dokdonella sp.]
MNRPFDAKRYRRLLEGLEVTVLKLSEVEQENEKMRLDSGYFAKLPVEIQKRIEDSRHAKLGSLCATFRKGIFDIKADSYVEEGIPFVRIANLRDGLISDAGLAYITEKTHMAEKATALRYGDLVLSKTAYAAASFVNLRECNASQDTIAVRLSEEGRRLCDGAYLAIYLNSKYGIALMRRQFQGNVQEHLSLDDGRKIPVPLFDAKLQAAVKAALAQADAELHRAEVHLTRAETTLTAALGLDGWQPPQALSYTRRASQAFTAGRLDAEYFSPRVSELLMRLRASGRTVGEVAPARRERFVPSANGTFRYIEIGAVNSDGTANADTVEMTDAPSRATQVVRAGDVITSTVRPIRRLSALVLPEQDGAVASSGFVVLKPQDVLAEALLTYLRLPLICELMDLHTSASLYPAISENDLLNLPFPDITETDCEHISQNVRDAHAARHLARDLLAAAQRAVEIAIEQDEAAALAYLAEQGSPD